MHGDKYIAKTLFGLEEILAREIESLGGTDVQPLNRAVSFNGDQTTLYRINYCSRLALRVIKPFLQFRAHNETVFYKRMRRYNWDQLFGLEQTFKINSVVHSSQFSHSRYMALKAKDAILDVFRLKKNGQRPNIDLEDPDMIIDVHCSGLDFTISLDSTGESLHRRGYRKKNRPAPLNEVLAAGMVMMSGWNSSIPLLDPMCGSGTILLEALMIAKAIPPRRNRLRYAFMNWNNFDRELWSQVRRSAILDQKEERVELAGFEIDARRAKETQAVIREMGFQGSVKVRSVNFFDEDPPFTTGMIISNPPYGKRMAQDAIESFYRELGDTLKNKYMGWSAWILSGNKTAIKSLGLKTSQRRMLYNGAIECKYHFYELYAGSRKTIGSIT